MTTDTYSPEGAERADLPSTWALLAEALATYREQKRAVFGIGFLGFLLVIATQAVMFFEIFYGPSSWSVLFVVSAIAFFLLEWWLGAALAAGMAHALEGAFFSDALRAGLRQSLSYLWFTVLINGLFFGYAAIFVALPAGILWAVFSLGFGAHTTGMLVAAIYAVGAALALLALFVGRYATALWVLIDGEARGVRAFILSARRSKPQLMAIASRIVFGGAVLVFGYVLLTLLGDSFAAPLGKIDKLFAQSVISGAISYLVFVPLALSLVRTVHERIRHTVPADEVQAIPSSERWRMLGLFWLGVAANIALFFVVYSSLNAFLSAARLPTGAPMLPATASTTPLQTISGG